MDTQAMELSIIDTTGTVNDYTGDPECFTCVCGKEVSDSDDGVSAVMQRCKVCYAAIREELMTNAPTHILAIKDTVGADDAFTDEAGGDYADQTDPPNAVTSVGDAHSVDVETIEAAMMSSISDDVRVFIAHLNGKSEIFEHYVDPINLSSSRKLFKRASWNYAPLYWYNIYGAMMTSQGKTLITPCAFRNKKGVIYILLAIGETLCNRPRYDGLVVELESEVASFLPNIANVLDELLVEFPFDGERINRIADLFITRNRFVFTPERGLSRDCKFPMKPDTELRKYLTKAVVAAEKSDTDERDHLGPSPQATISKKVSAEKKKAAKKLLQKKKKLPKKAIEIVDSEAEDDYFEVLPNPKKTRASADPILRDVTITAVAAPVPVEDGPPALYSSDSISALIAAASAATAAATAAAKAANDAIGRFTPPLLQSQHAAPSELFSHATVPSHDQSAPSAMSFASNSAGFPPCETFPALLYENIVQKMKLEELQRRESARQHAEDKAAFLRSFYSTGGGCK